MNKKNGIILLLAICSFENIFCTASQEFASDELGETSASLTAVRGSKADINDLEGLTALNTQIRETTQITLIETFQNETSPSSLPQTPPPIALNQNSNLTTPNQQAYIETPGAPKKSPKDRSAQRSPTTTNCNLFPPFNFDETPTDENSEPASRVHRTKSDITPEQPINTNHDPLQAKPCTDKTTAPQSMTTMGGDLCKALTKYKKTILALALIPPVIVAGTEAWKAHQASLGQASDKKPFPEFLGAMIKQALTHPIEGLQDPKLRSFTMSVWAALGIGTAELVAGTHDFIYGMYHPDKVRYSN